MSIFRKQKFFQSRKAFTLFTALISFILIALVTLLLGNMVAISHNTSEVISSIEEQTSMQAIADLAREDAFQTFNFNVRRKIEDYFTGQSAVIVIDANKSWQEIVKDFERQHFADPNKGVKAFAGLATSNIENILGNPLPVQGFDVSLYKVSDSKHIPIMKKALSDALNQAVIEGTQNNTLIELVGCDNTEPVVCENGSFFINLDLSNIEDSVYENLPQIRVENLSTGRVIKEPILPKGKFRIFVPIRLFKAISFVRNQAQLSVHAPVVRNRMKSVGLGICDPNSCFPRNNIVSGTQNISNKMCPTGRIGEIVAAAFQLDEKFTNNIVSLPFSSIGLESYNSGKISSQKRALTTLIKEELCGAAKIAFKEEELQDMKLIKSNECKNGANILDLEVDSLSFPTANINVRAKVGNGLLSSSDIGGFTENASCTKVNSLRIQIGVRETNPNYIVDKEIYDSNPNAAFKIELIDSYNVNTVFNKWNCESICEFNPITNICESTSCSSN